MYKIQLFVAFFLLSMGLRVANAVEIDNAALMAAQECLKNQNCDAAKTTEGQAAEKKALAVVGGNAANYQELKSLAAEVMPILLKQSGGDPAHMQTILKQAQENPENFLNLLPAETQSKIKNIAATVERNQQSGQKP
jgi:hypothetical protein